MLRHRLLRDVVLRAHVGNLRISAVIGSNAVAEGARRWSIDVGSKPSRLWSEYMMGTVMLSSFYKGEERVRTIVQAPTQEEIYVEAMAVGEVRGKATLVDENDTSTFAQSQMEVSKILYGSTKPYVTVVPATGVAQVDWQTFYDTSEQVPSVVRLGHAIEGGELRCCGLTVQKMPASAPQDREYDLADLRFGSTGFSASDIRDRSVFIEYLNELIPQADLTEAKCRKIPLDYFCRCSKKTFSARLSGIGHDQLQELMTDALAGDIELTCHFCNERYHFSRQDIKAIDSSLN